MCVAGMVHDSLLFNLNVTNLQKQVHIFKSFRIEVTEKKKHKHNHLFLSLCEGIILSASQLIHITNFVSKQFWGANLLLCACRHVTRKHHVCGGNTKGAWTCIHLGECLRCAMTNKHRDSLVSPLVSPHDNNFKFTETAET